ncbi:TetR/AcrR family transcriptional regulator [Rhizobium rhizogenes]|uniref:TetR/AcrR family transcriptional regulator n=1 Tax=Rhizobium rhizogenes TaxID=359 RepID=UPI002270B7E6|nr:TetR/AcrR family transcriptional regulator [Rhizobium rhizogenes]
MRQSISEQILEVAGVLFYREGVRAVGIERIIEEASIAKATLYRHFPSKDYLVAAYLSQRHERVINALEDVRRRTATQREQIEVIFQELFKKADSREFRGCAFALAVAEHGDSARIVDVAREHKRAVRAIFATILAEAGITDSQPARHLALLYEGALATVAVDRDPAAVLVAGQCALTVFDGAKAALDGRDRQ